MVRVQQRFTQEPTELRPGMPFFLLVLTRPRSPSLPDTLSPGNVLKELSDPAGAVIYTSRFQVGHPLKSGHQSPHPSQSQLAYLSFPHSQQEHETWGVPTNPSLSSSPTNLQLGDPTLNALEIWGAEYQESNALLLRPPDRDFLRRVSARERCPVCFVGTITGDRRVSWPQ